MYLSEYPEDMATIILSKMTDQLLFKFKHDNEKHDNEKLPAQELIQNTELSEKETRGLRYISGYIMHKLYRKVKTSPKWNSDTKQYLCY